MSLVPLLFAAVALFAGDSDPPLAITHVNVVPMDKDGVLADQTVVVQGGRIAELGDAADVPVPEGARVVDGRGKWLIPGLADMHVHVWAETDLLLFVANGVTTVRNMFGSTTQIEWRDEIAKGARIGPRIYTAGPIVDGDPATWPGSTVLKDPDAAAKIVARQKKQGYDFIKCYSGLKPDAFEALMAAAKQNGMRVMGHVPTAVSLEDAVSLGQESIEHFTGLVGCCQKDDSQFASGVSFRTESLAWKQMDDTKTAAIARLCTEKGAWNCPTLVVMQKWAKGKDAEALLARPEMRFVDPNLKVFWGGPMMYLARMPDEALAQSHAADADRLHALSVFHAEKAPLLVGTDMGNPYVVAGWSLHEELANFVAAGFTPFEALRAASADAARFMHAENEWGTIAPGRAADLILLEADPLADITNATKRTGVVVAGKYHAESELQDKLEALAKEFAPADEGK